MTVPSALMGSWQFWALLSALFAALTAIFAKIGVSDINSDFATLIRTCVVIAVLAAIVAGTSQWQPLSDISGRTWLFLALSGLGTGASWLCYFRALKLGDAARVAPVDKLSIVFVAVLGVVFLGERLSPLNWLGVGLFGAGIWLVAMK
jgi:transporter family protein